MVCRGKEKNNFTQKKNKLNDAIATLIMHNTYFLFFYVNYRLNTSFVRLNAF